MVKTDDPGRNEPRIGKGYLGLPHSTGWRILPVDPKESGVAKPRDGAFSKSQTIEPSGGVLVVKAGATITAEGDGHGHEFIPHSAPSGSRWLDPSNLGFVRVSYPGSHYPEPMNSDPVPLTEAAGGDLEEADRQSLLRRAAQEGHSANDPIRAREEEARQRAVELLGGEGGLGLAIRSEEDLLQALALGFPGQVLRALQDAGYPHNALEQVIAPRRTLMRRRGEGQRLTRAESDAAWRLAYVLAFASMVLNGPKAAIDWLMRAKPAFRDQKPIDLLETSVGTAAVERLLRQLDWGDVA